MKTTSATRPQPIAIMPQIIAFIIRGASVRHNFFISSALPKSVMDQLEGALRRTDAAMGRGGNHALNHGGGTAELSSHQAPPAAQIIGPARCPAGSAPTAVVRLARHGAQREVATGFIRSLPPSDPPDRLPIETAAQTLPRTHLGARSNFRSHHLAPEFGRRAVSPKSEIANRKSKFQNPQSRHELPPAPSRQ